jgi:UDP-N-acetylmuramate: L-alanyl-gamma-D-glutamyl-meso-diaminopimelate ligase
VGDSRAAIEFEQTLPVALALADRVVLAGVFRAQQLGDENRLEPEAVAESVRELGKSALVFPSADAIAEQVSLEAEPGDVLLVMSNGSFDGLCEKLLAKLGQPVQVSSEASTR